MERVLDKKYFLYRESIRDYFKEAKNNINGKRYNTKVLSKKFPELYQLIVNNNDLDIQKEIIYCIFFNIESIPTCKNEKCSNHTILRNLQKGFQNFCCVECQNEWQRYSKDFRNNISKALQEYKKEKNKNTTDPFKKFLLKYDYEKETNYFILHNFCKHGDLKIYGNLLTKKFNNEMFDNMCPKCNQEIFDTYIPTEKEIEDFRAIFPEFYKKHHYALKRSWWMLYYPKYLKILTLHYEKYFGKVNDVIQRGVYYVFMNNLTEAPICRHPGCNNHTDFSRTDSWDFNLFCSKHVVGYNASGVELELEEYINILGVNCERNKQHIIKGEFDFYFPENNLAIEFNGVWFHCDRFAKKETYHQNKFTRARNKGILLISVWEDDWNFKKDLVKSLINSKLGIFTKTIPLKDCIIKKNIPEEELRSFIDSNFIDGYSVQTSNYCLYYKDELVSAISLNEFSLVTYVKNRNYKIEGDLALLTQEFFKDNPEEKLRASINCDVEDYNEFIEAGFQEDSLDYDWRLFWKGKRYRKDEEDFIKKENKGRKIFKCYSTGTMKLVLENNQIKPHNI